MALQLFKIASVEVATPQANIDFTSIPQGYTDLVLKLSIRRTDAVTTGDDWIQFNGDTGSNYNWRRLYGTGSTTGSQSGTGIGGSYLTFIYSGAANGASATANTFSNMEIYIPNYTSSNYKSVSWDSVAENNATAAQEVMTAGIWSSTSAINRITYTTGTLSANTTATLYGVL